MNQITINHLLNIEISYNFFINNVLNIFMNFYFNLKEKYNLKFKENVIKYKHMI